MNNNQYTAFTGERANKESERTRRASEQGERKGYSRNFLRVYKKGKFYHSLGDSSKILKYLFNYKIKDGQCGFPDTALNKVISTLEDKKISYILIYKDREDIKRDFKDLNKYDKVLSKALASECYQERINNILNKLKEIDNKDTLEKILISIENTINEY